jgi:ubiquinone/menaquinone biosynthesis C-methylase UbiE
LKTKTFDTNGVALQRSYYERTACRYDRYHLQTTDEHEVACRFISAFSRLLGAATLLDVGCGTGRALRILGRRNPELVIHGVDVSEGMLKHARAKFGANSLLLGEGANLPFNDNSYDIVMETGVLHHVRQPDKIVREMMRVARKAVFISDHNIFGQGSAISRRLKWALYRAKLWHIAKLLQNRGRDYCFSDGDGVVYSYSAYFQYRLLERWPANVLAISTSVVAGDSGCFSPLFGAKEVLLCALKGGLAV